jgi:ABC-2 type transport system ATP-binding protein
MRWVPNMIYEVEIKNLSYTSDGLSEIIHQIDAKFAKGSFVALLGENGAGKTTLLDIIMGFKRASSGEVNVRGKSPSEDPWEERQNIVYLSEKMDIPGDWSVRDYFEFNRFFYNKYSSEDEKKLMEEFRVNESDRLGNMSAGEIRRVQIVGALSCKPSLIIVDEITAVLDIVGRRRFMTKLYEQNKKHNCTVLLATNILEELERYISDVMIMKDGRILIQNQIEMFMKINESASFPELVANRLELI